MPIKKILFLSFSTFIVLFGFTIVASFTTNFSLIPITSAAIADPPDCNPCEAPCTWDNCSCCSGGGGPPPPPCDPGYPECAGDCTACWVNPDCSYGGCWEDTNCGNCGPPPPPTCSEETYNECTGTFCESRTIHQNSDCSYSTLSTQCDEGCGSAGCCSGGCAEETYNECVACNTSQTVHRHTDCSYHIHGTQSDPGCSSWCAGGGGPGDGGGGPPPPPGGPVCNYDEVSLSVSPNPVPVGQSINFSITGDASTFIGDSWTGGVTGCSGPWNNITCTSTAPASTYTWTHEWKHCEGSFDNCSPVCSESAPFTVTPPPTGTIQGYKVVMPGNQAIEPAASQTVRLDGGSPTTANPYSYAGVSAAAHTVSATIPSGWSVGYTLCYNDTSCHNNPPTSASSASVNVPSGGYADLWWHYSCTPSSPPSGPTLTAPPNGASLTTSSVTLDWNALANWGNQCSDPTSNDVYRVYLQSFDCISAPDPSTQVGSVTRDSGVTELPVSGLTDNTCYVWKVRADSGVGFTDSGPRTFRVLLNANAWWQTKDGDMLSSGNIRSLIPQQCVDSPTCTEEFSLPGGGGYPGVVAYSGGSATFTQGVVSNKGWLVNSGYYGRRYDYSWFARLAPPEVFTDPNSVITDSQINGGDLVSGFASGGYVWRYRNGDLTVNGTANLGNRKVILFINGNLNLNGNITLTDGEGFFMAIAKGNIQVSPSVSHPNQPALEGFFVTDATFSTGTQNPTPDNRLYIRGSIAAWSGVALQRNLDPNRTNGGNNTTPGELIEFPPDLIFTFPRQLAREGIVWREVAP